MTWLRDAGPMREEEEGSARTAPRASVPAGGGEERLGSPSEDVALVRALRNGDRGAFEELYRRYARMVHGIVLARVPRETRTTSCRTSSSSCYGAFWICATKRRSAAGSPRSRATRLAISIAGPPPPAELPADVPGGAPADGEAEWILEIVRGLPEAYRETLILRLVEGNVRTGDRGAHGAHRGLGSREPASRHEAAPREARGKDPSMSDDYLWDGSGEPDPDIQKLEKTLAALRSTRPAPSFPEAWDRGRPPATATAADARGRTVPMPRRRWLVPTLAAAAVVIVAAGLAVRQAARTGSTADWEVASLSGSPTIDAGPVAGTGRLGVGEWLETTRRRARG
jgi:RNA polymerase sigma-70 factor (ECF subfamily)